MKFEEAESTINLEPRMLSENGVWELGLYRVLYGYRVRAGIVGEMSVVVDYCSADQTAFTIELFKTIRKILEQVDESVPTRAVFLNLPDYNVRPIINDKCWPILQELSEGDNFRCLINKKT